MSMYVYARMDLDDLSKSVAWICLCVYIYIHTYICCESMVFHSVVLIVACVFQLV